MTDGILLNEIHRDRLLRRYDTIIIDEAHERVLNVDFLIGYLRRMLPQRPDLKVIVTSATIDPESFAEAFRGCRGSPPRSSRSRGGPIPSTSATDRPARREARGRRRDAARPPTATTSTASSTALRRARPRAARRRARVPSRRGRDPGCDGCGPRNVREGCRSAPRCSPSTGGSAPPSSTGSSSAPASPACAGRVILATNVAETSLTVPGIRYVIDTGTARISRYSVAQQDPAPADRGDLAGIRAAAIRTCRAHRAGHRDPAVLRGGLREPRRVHRARDPPHQPRLRDPADARAGLRRHLGIPVPHSARLPRSEGGPRPAGRTGRGPPVDSRDRRSPGRARHPHRPRARDRATADRPAVRTHAHRGEADGCASRRARDRRGDVDPGRPRTARRAPRARPTGCTRASPTRRATS